MDENKTKTPWGEYIDKTTEDFKEAMKRWESIESKEVPFHEAHKEFKPGDTIQIRSFTVPEAKSEVIEAVKEIKGLKERIEVLERIVTSLLIDDNLKI